MRLTARLLALGASATLLFQPAVDCSGAAAERVLSAVPLDAAGVTSIPATAGRIAGTGTESRSVNGTRLDLVGPFADEDDSCEVLVLVDEDSVWDLSLRYYLPTESGDKINSISVNDRLYGSHSFAAGADLKETLIGPLALRAGENTIRFFKGPADWGWMYLESFCFEKNGAAEEMVSDVNTELIDPDATDETKRLYSYLVSQYGTRVLSGQQLYFSPEEEIARLLELTGKKPAIKGYDFLNQTEGAPRDDQIERAIRWVEDENGILTLCWHWFAPLGGRAFYTKDTRFDIREAVREGTPEHELILRDIDTISAQLLDLQERGIPVLWRPLHEASGGWFWWGAHGPEAFIELWRLMYHRMVEKHGLHNLIWVYNGQHPDWYVGDEYCDIIGEDIYPGERVYSAHPKRFREAWETVRGKKIVALTENGALPDLDEMERCGAMWAWFCPWWGEWITTDRYSEDEVIISVYSDPRVITLADLPADLYGEAEDAEVPDLQPERFAGHSAAELVAAMQPGWNLGNTLDATGGETSWGNPPARRALFAAIHEAGYNSVRIPVTWSHAVGAAPEYIINAGYLRRVREVVDMALAEGLIVMLNLHHDSAWLRDLPDRTEELMERFRAIWEQIAAEFRDHPRQLLLEPINEPRFSDDWGEEPEEFLELTDLLNRTAYGIIRSSGGGNATRPVVMETLTSGISERRIGRLAALIEDLGDPDLIASVHYYGLWQFSMNIDGHTNFDTAVQRDIDRVVDLLETGLVEQGIPVILGEYGLLGFDLDTDTIEQGEKLKFFDALVSRAAGAGIATMWWDNGQHFDRLALEWRDPLLHETILQAVTGRSGQTGLDMVFLPEGELEDLEVPLLLNGNRLTGIRTGLPFASGMSEGEAWVETEDYEVEGDTLILREAALDRLTDGGTMGQRRLTLEFDAGPDWILTVIVTGEAALTGAEGRSTDFLLPARFQADRVRRVRATVGGQPVGEDGWTPWLRQRSEYDVDYGHNLIRLYGAIFSPYSDATMELEVEMWSGRILPYTIEVDGRTKQGRPGPAR